MNSETNSNSQSINDKALTPQKAPKYVNEYVNKRKWRRYLLPVLVGLAIPIFRHLFK
jgi:hypothetical protein